MNLQTFAIPKRSVSQELYTEEIPKYQVNKLENCMSSIDNP